MAKEIKVNGQLIDKLEQFRNTAQEVHELLEKEGVEDKDLSSIEIDAENSKIILISKEIESKFVGKKDLPLIGVVIVFLLTVLQGLGILQIGNYDPEAVYRINWANVPTAIIELVVIVFLAEKRGILPWISRKIAGVKKR